MSSFTSLLSLGALAATALGSPVPAEIPHLAPRAVSDFQCFNASLPNITIFATGGTIAGSAGSADQTTGYQAGALGIKVLIDAVPELCNISNVRGVQIANVDSSDITSTILTNLTHQIQAQLDSPYTQGVVVTHGTDTLEESSFFLDLTVQSDKPVVVVGSMRPATAISADGPINLLSAVKLAASDSAKKRGTLITLNDRIASARPRSRVTWVPSKNIQPVFWYPAVRPLGHHYFNISSISASEPLPKVDVLYGQQEVDPELFAAAVEGGAKGIVVAGVGAGGWPTKAKEQLEEVVKKTKVPVVISRRTAWGFVSGQDYGINAGYLNPAKARIQLQLALAQELPAKEIKEIFEYTHVQ
ncbi:hypothetical protein CEP52_012628 [Fusarium oligoseptatum]|uniref:asparaginase n=1 Tax=Fusarium oligoseptatum TaxID=2604345 RepID=A0A428SXJ5_9HYPO|nr:hypothetical protein CEP52_012628 [Fusarium oligoseptatum]